MAQTTAGSNEEIKKFYRITWLDIVAREDDDKEAVDRSTPTSLLAEKQNTVGYIYKEDDTAIVLCRDEDEVSISYLVIPKCVIIDMKRLYSREVCPAKPKSKKQRYFKGAGTDFVAPTEPGSLHKSKSANSTASKRTTVKKTTKTAKKTNKSRLARQVRAHKKPKSSRATSKRPRKTPYSKRGNKN